MVSTGYYAKRITQALITIWGSITLSFVIIHSMPGSPAEYLAARLSSMSNMSRQEINQMVELYLTISPDKSMWEQYVDYMSAIVFEFDLGRSMAFNEPVVDVLLGALPWTIFVSTISVSFGTIMFLLIGSFLATKEGSKWDVLGSYFVMFSDSVPYYIVALVLLFMFGFGAVADLFPTQGKMASGTTPGLNVPFMKGVIYHAALPIISFALTAWGGLSFRAHCTRILGEDYIRVGRLRGLRDSRIMTRYVAWNSLLPMYTGIMASLAAIFGGSIIMETIFTYTGMGYYMWQAIEYRDYPLMLGGLIIFTVVTVIALLIADLTYGWIDPRISNAQTESFGTNFGLIFTNVYRRLRSLSRRSESPQRLELERVDLDAMNRVNEDKEAASDGGGRMAEPGASPERDGEGLGGRIRTRKRHYYRLFDQLIRTPARILWTAPRARVGLIIIALFVFMGYVAPRLVAAPQAFAGPIELQPFENPQHPLGTDKVGVDLVSRLIYSTKPMLQMMFAGALFASVVGAMIGIASGYFGGMIDWVLTTITDITINIPGIPLIVVLAAIFQPENPAVVGIVLAIDDWPSLARQLRSEVLTIREKSYVEAARTMGLSSSTIFSKKILAGLMPLITMNTVRAARNIIFVSAGLYFLGILPYTTLNWGVWLNSARESGSLSDPSQFYLMAIPLMAIATLSLGLMLFSQGTDRLFNPRIRARHAKTVTEGGEDQEAV